MDATRPDDDCDNYCFSALNQCFEFGTSCHPKLERFVSTWDDGTTWDVTYTLLLFKTRQSAFKKV